MSSTPVRDAASISIRSTNRPSRISLQLSHSPQGFGVMPVSQLRHRASRRPMVVLPTPRVDRKSTRLNSSHVRISYAVFCLKKKKNKTTNYNIPTNYTPPCLPLSRPKLLPVLLPPLPCRPTHLPCHSLSSLLRT